MHHISSALRRFRALTPAAILLLVLCLFAGGAQAITNPVDTAALVNASALAPYPGTHPVPGLVQAKDYDLGGEGVAYHDTELANLGGAYRPAEGVDIETAGLFTDVGWIRDGEWLTYTVNATEPQDFVVWFRAANPDATTKRVAISADGVPAGTVDLRPTGSFDNYADSNSTPISLPAGETTVRLSFDGVSRVNLLEFDFQLANPPEPTPVPTPAPELLVSTPGLHTLDHDITADHIGVMITSPDVVFDGMGHTIAGTGANGSIGVYATGPSFHSITNVTVRNLTVRHWDSGIFVGGVSSSVVEDVVAEQNSIGAQYISYGGTTNDHIIRDSVFRENINVGLDLFYPTQGVAIERCSFTGNGVGITAETVRSSDRTTNHLAECDVSENAGDGLYSHDGSFATVRNCTVRANGGNGLEFEHDGAEIVGNRIEGNAGDGVHASDRGGCDIHGNWITGNGVGVVVGGDWGSRVRNNLPVRQRSPEEHAPVGACRSDLFGKLLFNGCKHAVTLVCIGICDRSDRLVDWTGSQETDNYPLPQDV